MKPFRPKGKEDAPDGLLPEVISDMFRRLSALENESKTFIAGTTNKFDRMEGQIKSLDESAAKVADLEKWNFVLKWFLRLLAVGVLAIAGFVLRLFWHHPDWWPKLVEFLK
jgi:hypothetical protein